jgi:cyclic pyranopterin phosphate synthase
MNAQPPLVDSFGRVHSNLRISVTDRCNIRCFYCMPDEFVRFKPRDELLSFEELARFTRIMASLGVHKVRLTGGEPLLRSGLDRLVAMLAAVPGITDLALTTNGILLADQAHKLKKAGLIRLNISLDALSEQTFRRISRRDGLDHVLRGIFAAQHAGFERIRLNAVAIRGITEVEVVPLGRFARRHGLEMRFIEYMPLDADHQWQSEQVLSGDEIRRILEEEFGPLVPRHRADPGQPANDFQFADGVGRIGFINPISQPFCDRCNRLRISADGMLRNCLFSTTEFDARALLRSGKSDQDIIQLARDAIAGKKPGHGIDDPAFVRPQHAMYEIGG